MLLSPTYRFWRSSQQFKRWASEFAKIERGDFERAARALIGRLAILRTLVAEAGAS